MNDKDTYANAGLTGADASEAKMHKEQMKRSKRHRRVVTFYLLLYDMAAVNFSYFLGLWLRFDLRFTQIPREYLEAFVRFVPAYTLASALIFMGFGLYRSLWKFASYNELNRILGASLASTIFHIVGVTALEGRMPASYYVFGPVIQVILVTGVRFGYRYISLERSSRSKRSRAAHNAMIIGAGDAGQIVLRELLKSAKSDTRPVCLIDDDPNKWGCLLEGVPVEGGRDSILEAVDKYKVDQILFAIPTAPAQTRRDILNICKETGCELKTLPGIYQLANGEVSLSRMKPVAVEDLLGRETIKVNTEEILEHLRGRTVLVTGGGGSIGSELCRQIAGHEPKRLIIFDIYENNAYDIEQELRKKYPDLQLDVLIGSVRDSRRINWVFEHYKPDIVYHAAAHKHVPLMETSPNEAIKNNVIGTYKTAYAALKNGTKRFVLISTDKAVNPTNIMGASKRLCEMVIQSMDAISKAGRMDLLPFLHAHANKVIDGQVAQDPMDHMAVYDGGKSRSREKSRGDSSGVGTIQISSVKNKERAGTQFVAVRFGNVLGSNGSVIPLFKKQIEAGGPVTVTHPDIIRYFMTIPEAVSLVLQAGTYAWGGEIFVLDMGEPVKIDTLARNLIKLSGFKPDEDIKIVYTGLRPGEKLFEEKLMAEEGMKKTDNALIHIGKPIPFDVERFLGQLEELAKASYENSDRIVEMVKEIVTTYHPAEEKVVGMEKRKDQTVDEGGRQRALDEAAVTVAGAVAKAASE